MEADLNCHLVRDGGAGNHKSLFLLKAKICLKLIFQNSRNQPKAYKINLRNVTSEKHLDINKNRDFWHFNLPQKILISPDPCKS